MEEYDDMPTKREKPEDADMFEWNKFEQFANDHGYGYHTDDWDAWWECWKAGFVANE